jgi:anaerobic selenocysteine-containing dehydrogenase
VAEMAEATIGMRSDINWRAFVDDYHLIRDDIGLVVPGFTDFNDVLYDEGSIELPHAVRDELRFDNAAGKALFTVHDIEPPEVPAGHYLMMTIRSHDQFNTTVYSQNDRYRGIKDSRLVIFMHPTDIETAGLAADVTVSITSHHEGATRSMQGFRIVPFNIPLGCVATYYPETNPLIPVKHVADGSNTPAYKSVVVSIN